MRALVLAGSLALGVAACARPTAVETAQRQIRLRRDAEARASLEAHLRKDPRDIAARRLLVRVHAWSGDLEAARREAATLQRLLPGDPVAWIELGHALELAHRFDEALAAYDMAGSVAPRSAAGPREGGMRAAHWGEPEDARPRLEEAVRRGAHDGETFHALGLVRLNLGDLDGAEAAYRQGLAAAPRGTENLLGLATVAVARGDAAAALTAYDALLVQRPTFAPAELGRAWALAKLGRAVEAERALDRAEELGLARAKVERQRAKLRGQSGL